MGPSWHYTVGLVFPFCHKLLSFALVTARSRRLFTTSSCSLATKKYRRQRRHQVELVEERMAAFALGTENKTFSILPQIYDYFLVLDFEATCNDKSNMIPQVRIITYQSHYSVLMHKFKLCLTKNPCSKKIKKNKITFYRNIWPGCFSKL